MHNQCRAVRDRVAKIWGGRGVIHDQRKASFICDISDCAQVGNVAAGICDGFTENRTGVVIDRGFHCGGIVEINELCRPAEALDGLAELGDRASIKAG